MANISTISYNGNVIAETEEAGDVVVTYDGRTIANITAGETKNILCNGKVMKTNLYIGAKTLLCEMAQMISDIVIAVKSAFPEAPTAYNLIGTYTASQTWTAPEDGYFQIEVFGASGNGGKSNSDDERYMYLGSGGGGGGYACSKGIKLNKGDAVALVCGAVGETSSSTINSSVESYSALSVTSGASGTNATTSALGSAGSGGVASGGNYANANGNAGTKGERRTFISFGTFSGGAGGAAGYSGGNVGGAGGGYYYNNSPAWGSTAAGSGAAGFIKIYRGNTNPYDGPTNPVFYIKDRNNVTHEYQFESGMDFQEFVNSSYNDGKFTIGTAKVLWNVSNATVYDAVMFNNAAICTQTFYSGTVDISIMVSYYDGTNESNRIIVANKTYYCATTW